MSNQRLTVMMEIAVMAALAYALSFVKFGGLWPQGGSISLVMIPIIVLAFRRGWMAGVVAGFLVGIIKLLLGGYVVHPVQLILDYPLPYAAIGLAGLFALKPTYSFASKIGIATVGIIIAATVRLLSHFTAGVIWFGSYAPEGMPVETYSFLYNISYLAPETLISLIAVLLLVKVRPQIFQARMIR